ncbi:MAG: hypothetical protein EHM58_03445 [Ignavibacteriae bacterium]|nr:MAG: hypothetical protein EHM58_03445 [Ignavibacteriota bacterium]
MILINRKALASSFYNFNFLSIIMMLMLSGHYLFAAESDTLKNKFNYYNELGLIEGMPFDYPSDIPLPMNSKCIGHMTTSEGVVVTFESNDIWNNILYDFALRIESNGYKKKEKENINDYGGFVAWVKDEKEVNIMIAKQFESEKVEIAVTYN